MPENLGIAKGYVELDLTRMKSAVESGEQYLKKLEAAGKLTQSEFDKLQDQTDKNASSFEKASKKAQELSAKIDNCKQKSNLYKSEISGLTQIIERNKNEQDSLKGKLEQTEKAYENQKQKMEGLKKKYEEARTESEKLKKEFGENSEQAQKAADKAEKLGNEYENAKKKTSEYEQEISQLESKHDALGREIDESGDKIVEFKTKLNQTETELQGMQRELEESQNKAKLLGDEMEKQGGRIKAAGEKISGIGSTLTMGVTAPIVGAAGAASKMAMDAEESYAKVASIADLDVMNMEQIKSGVQDLSNEMGISVQDINEAMYQAISATADTGNALGYVKVGAKTAVGGFTDVATAIDGLTSVTNAYGMQGVDAMQQVADYMLMTQNYGKTTVDDLARSMGQVVPTAHAAGISLEELFSIMAVLTRNGIKTEQAVTGTKAALSNLIKPSEQAKKAAKELEIDFDAAAIESKGLTGVLMDVKAGLQEAAPTYMAIAENQAITNKQMAELEAAGQKGSDAYKFLAKMSKEYDAALETLASAQDSELAGYATLFGSVEGLNAMMVLASDTGMADMQTAMDLMNDSAGATNKAFQTMTNTTGYRLRQSMNQLKNRGIELGEKLLPYVDKGVQYIGKLVDKFDSLSDEEQEQILKFAGIAAAAGPVLKVVGGVTEGVGGIVGGIGKMIGKTSEVGGAATSAASVASGAFSGFGGVLSSLAAVAGPIALVTGAIVGIGLAVEAVDKKLTQESLKEHFGDIKLSAEEVEEVADRLTTRPWTVNLDAEIEAREELLAFEEEYHDTVSRLNKTEWKVKAGIELTEEEQAQFQSDISSFITQSQQLLTQQQLTTTLAINTLFDGSVDKAAKLASAESFYQGLNEQLTTLGEDLATLVNDAFSDKVLDEDELDKIVEKQAEIQKVMDKISQAKYEVNLENIVADAKNSELSEESFQDLQKALSDKLQERKEQLENARIEALVPYQVKLNEGEIEPEQFDKARESIDREFQSKLGMLALDNINYEIETIQGNYSQATNEAGSKFAKDLTSTFQSNLNQSITAGGVSLDTLQERLETQFGALPNALTPRMQSDIKTLMENMQPDIAETEALYQRFMETGEKMPEGLREGLMNTLQLQAMAGDVDAQYKMIAMQLQDSPELQTTLALAEATGQSIPESLRTAMETLSPQIYDSTIGLLKQIQNGEEATEPELRALFDTMGITVSDDLINALASKEAEAQQGTINLLAQIQSGTGMKENDVRNTLMQFGISAGSSLISSLYSKEPEVQQEAILLLSQLQNADAAKRAEILAQLHELGIETDDSIIEGMDENSGNVNEKAAGVITGAADSMEAQAEAESGKNNATGGKMGDDVAEGVANATDGVHVGDVEIGTNDPYTVASGFWATVQNYLTNNPLSVAIRGFFSGLSGGPRTYADGGIATEPSIAGEAGAEMIIPLSTSKRTRALNLLSQTESILRTNSSTFNSYSVQTATAPFAISDATSGGGLNYRRLAVELADVLRNAPITPQVQVEMRDGDVYIDKEKAGQKLAPVVTRIQNKKI